MTNKKLDINLDRLTEHKAADICERNDYEVMGVVLRKKNGDACIVEQSAVRWIDNKDFWEIMHPHTDRYMDNNMKMMTYLVVNFANEYGDIPVALELAIKATGFSRKEVDDIVNEAADILKRAGEEI